ncbi:MAG: asparagine synthase (glutamine-hydrolyzing), partial [Lachnospiraceae bacterium]|nr:asparagine synthase (glutamine-hydrolyzing) [Lachnospiraceae bacterium]
MCGIVGYIDKKSLSENVLRAMMDKIKHRGPDGSGVYLDDTIALGHQRLSIIDLEGGIQPMKNQAGNLICVFNGEIYNFKDLRKKLERKGYIFQTNSDTEVLLYGYEAWGNVLPNKLRGMFAFAIWDKNKQELFCARDYFGIKPFYYYHKDHTFLFGSEIKSFLENPHFEKRLNQKQLDLYLSYQYSPTDTTFFQDVYRLMPAHYMIWKNGTITIKRYWQPEFIPDNTKTKAEWETLIQKVMHDSVSAHKISDVEVGSFLSSGVDSSYITALANVNQTFTIGFHKQKYNEALYVQKFSQEIGVENTIYHISPSEYWKKLPEMQYMMDEPLADASSIALYFLNREASKKVKVCLSGEGADELFGGYHIYKEPLQCKYYDMLPLFLRKGIGKVASCFPCMKGINFFVRHGKPLEERYIGNTMIFSEKQKKQILKKVTNNVCPTDISKPYFTYLKSADAITRMQFTDIEGNFKNVAITSSQLEKALNNDCMFDCSLVEGM